MELWEGLPAIDEINIYSIVDDELLIQAKEDRHRKIREFTNSFKLVNGNQPSCMKTLQYFMENYPSLVYFGPPDHRGLRIFFHREKLLKIIDATHKDKTLRKLDFYQNNNVNFVSFERGLKHAGLKVLEPTSDKNKIKKWGIEWNWHNQKVKSNHRKRSRVDSEEWKPEKLEVERQFLFCEESSL